MNRCTLGPGPSFAFSAPASVPPPFFRPSDPHTKLCGPTHPTAALTFLRLPFNNKDAEGILKGDAVLVVDDEPLYVHKFILVGDCVTASSQFSSFG
jgi:hypothetical protein